MAHQKIVYSIKLYHAMKKLFFFFFILSFTFFSYAQETTINSGQIHKIDSTCDAYFKTLNAGGVIMVAQNGTPLFKKAYGLANAELNVPMTTDHKLGIGSISKQFAAVAILLLQKENKLNVKDDIRKYLPSYNTHGRTITIENILSHTSGIPSYTELYGFDTLVSKSVSNHKLIKFFEGPDLLFEPGSNWSYSNSGFILAAIIVEKVSGKPFNDFIQEKIFGPLLMSETSMGTSDYVLNNKTAEYGGVVPKGRFKMDTQYDWYWAFGAGQIVSTANDMLKWDQALYNEKFIPANILGLANKSFVLTTGQPANYGLGWGIGTIRDKALIQHGGAIGGYRAQAVRIPEDHIYVLVLSNYGTVNSSLISNRILSILYGIPELKDNENLQTDLKSLEGVYESLNAGSRVQTNFSKRNVFYTIRTDSNQVSVYRTGGNKTILAVADRDVLYNKANPYVQWKFDRNSKGEVLGFRVNSLFGTFGPERYNKKTSTPIPPVFMKQKTDAAAFSKFTGIYEHEFGDRVKIRMENNELKMYDLLTGQEDKLLFLGANRFYIQDREVEFFFETDKKGVKSLRYFDGAYEIVMKKVDELY